MDVFDVISTTRAMRRLDPARPVPDDALWRILEAGSRGPSGGNRQPVRWVVVREPARRARLGEIYRECWDDYRAAVPDASWDDPQIAKNMRSAEHLASHLHEVPVIVLACARRRGYIEAAVFPCVQNLTLAARALGLGTTITTMHRAREGDVKALLAIPDDVEVFALIPVGYPLGRWGEAPRRPVDEVVHWDGWDITQSR